MMNKQFASKQEIQNFLHDYCVELESKKTEEEKNIFFQFGVVSIDTYLPTTEDKVRVIKESGYNLDNFKADAHFDQEWIEIYKKV